MFVAGITLAPLGLSARAQEQPAPNDTQVQTQTTPPSSTAPPAPPPAVVDDGSWHLDLSPYFWLAGTHGTVGVLGRNASVHASPWDLLQHFDFGLMGAAEARRKKFVLTGDLLWIRLSDSHAQPFPNFGATSADVRVGELVWTSKVGYRVVDQKKIKADALVGARFWHLGQKLNFNPSLLGLNVKTSQNWADIVVGGRVELPMGPKTSVIALGDVGGWNATAKLDYQFAALLGYKISSRWTLSAGYRYLFVDYRQGLGVYNMVTSGAILGATYHFK